MNLQLLVIICIVLILIFIVDGIAYFFSSRKKRSSRSMDERKTEYREETGGRKDYTEVKDSEKEPEYKKEKDAEKEESVLLWGTGKKEEKEETDPYKGLECVDIYLFCSAGNSWKCRCCGGENGISQYVCQICGERK